MSTVMLTGSTATLLIGIFLIGRFDSTTTLFLGALCVGLAIPLIAAASQYGGKR